ncbi:NlpC/P60 family protein [Pelotomaculum propionicicum]|uniref:C40 family peptidase n=1 Tax=Pelotomaculum propionicicum TaxID=258475 RepID=UPI003B76D0B0
MDKTSRGLLIAVILAVLLYLVYQFSTGYPLAERLKPPGKKPAPIAPDNGQNAPDTADSPERGAVRVAATVFWCEPGQARDYDRSLLKENNDPAGWAGGMDGDMRLWLVGKAETMALYGEPVVVLERRGDWVKVAAESQKTSLNVLGYPGWVPASHIAIDHLYNKELKNLPNVVVADKSALIFKNPALTELRAEAGYMTRLPLLEEGEQTVTVRLPGGDCGYLSRGCIKKASDLYFSQAGIVEEAKKFLNLRYIWAGTTPYGFDCSGFTMRLYQSQGISIPRDADEQAREGTAVAREDLLPGDLVFFAAKGGLGQIHHVGMYIGNGMMIHSPNSSCAVTIQAVESGAYGEEYWGARRYAN